VTTHDASDSADLLTGLPAPIRALLSMGSWQHVTIGKSGHVVYRVRLPDADTCYLKMAPRDKQGELEAEYRRLRWLHGRLPVADARLLVHDDTWAYLVQSAASGIMACDATFAADVPRLARLLGEGLRQVHSVSAAECPFDERLDCKIALAWERVQAGLVDEADFDAGRRGTSASTLFAELVRTRPRDEELVFTHGDYCLPNVLIDPVAGRVSGFVDLARAGVADRYQDLALAARSLAYNFGPGWEPYLWEAYGIVGPDPARLAFYQLLDEFF
jgi:aminoglycoside phosphotransferase